ncbi:hypothetical protein NPIL_500661 [Nephila pilipes]|uniref:Uncharacterized protein n=1 Tax=Nephila pilipes TaxID=299642 RepID=A0A8X6U0A6_NEPPI|nr:hypothetical protein NPIL_500661 [Nephila pilipes]
MGSSIISPARYFHTSWTDRGLKVKMVLHRQTLYQHYSNGASSNGKCERNGRATTTDGRNLLTPLINSLFEPSSTLSPTRFDNFLSPLHPSSSRFRRFSSTCLRSNSVPDNSINRVVRMASETAGIAALSVGVL